MKKNILYVLGHLIMTLSSFLAVVVYTRIMTPEVYGFLSVVLSVVEIGLVNFFFWQRMVAQRYFNEFNEAGAVKNYLGSMQALFILIGFLIILIGGAVLLLANFDKFIVISTCALLLFKAAALYVSDMLRIMGYAYRYMLVSIIQAFGVIGGGALAFIFHGNVTSVVFTVAAFYLISAAVGGRSIFRLTQVMLDRAIWARVSGYAMPLLIGAFVLSLLYRFDKIILTASVDIGLVGIYSAVYSVVFGLISTLFTAFVSVSYPIILRTSAAELASEVYAKTSTILIVLGVSAVAFLSAMKGDIISVFLGDAYNGYAVEIVTPCAVMSLLFCIKTHVVDQSFHLSEKSVAMLVLNVPLAIFSLLFCYLAAKLYGVVAYTWMSATVWGVGIVFGWWWASKFYPIKVKWFDIFSGVIYGLILAFMVYYINGMIDLIFYRYLMAVMLGVVYLAGLYFINFCGINKIKGWGHA